MLIFEEGGKPENPEKNPRSKDKNQQQTQPTYDTGSRIQTRATLVGGEHDHHCAIPAPTRHECCVLATLLIWGTSNTILPLRFPLLLSIHHCENDFGTKVTSEVGVTWYFDCAIQIPSLRAKWLNFEGL